MDIFQNHFVYENFLAQSKKKTYILNLVRTDGRTDHLWLGLRLLAYFLRPRLHTCIDFFRISQLSRVIKLRQLFCNVCVHVSEEFQIMKTLDLVRQVEVYPHILFNATIQRLVRKLLLFSVFSEM